MAGLTSVAFAAFVIDNDVRRSMYSSSITVWENIFYASVSLSYYCIGISRNEPKAYVAISTRSTVGCLNGLKAVGFGVILNLLLKWEGSL